MFKKAIHGACVVAAISFVTAALPAATVDRTTYFTFASPVRVAGVLLPPGNYGFAIGNPNGSADVVRVFARNGSKQSVYTLTRPIIRPSTPQLEAVITFREAKPGAPPPIDAWYPHGSTTGRQFLD